MIINLSDRRSNAHLVEMVIIFKMVIMVEMVKMVEMVTMVVMAMVRSSGSPC